MILSQPQVKSILTGARPSWLRDADTYSKKMRMHLNGVNIESHLEQITGVERKAIYDLRVKYTKSTKDLFARLSRPLDRVFSAKGGSISWNLDDAQERRAAFMWSNLTAGISGKKWLETVWMPHMNDDPNGIIFIEMVRPADMRSYVGRGKSVVYPTYKSVTSIHNYQLNGNRLEWVAFIVSNDDKRMEGIETSRQVFRVVDDALDAYYEVVGEEVRLMPEPFTYPNYFGEVPGIINSDIVNPENEQMRLSFFDKAVDLADDYFLKGSIKKTHDFLHGFPKYVEFSDACNACGGSGYKGADKCNSCGGTGRQAMTKVSDIKMLEYPTNGDPVIKPSETGGYIEPSKLFHEMSNSDMLDLENAMNITIWGAESVRKKVGVGMAADTEKTATQVVSEVRPEADRLHCVSEMAEVRHKFLLDAMIRINIQNNFGGASVTYGRRYMLESTDAIWDRYTNARKQGSPNSVLDEMLNEYYEARFMSDELNLAIAKKLMYVEPFVHLTAEQVQKLNPSEQDYKAKLYYSDWLATKTPSELLVKTAEQLRADLQAFVTPKQLPAAVPAAAAAPSLN